MSSDFRHARLAQMDRALASEATLDVSTEGRRSAKAPERVRNCADLRDRVTTEGPPSDFVAITVAGGAEAA